MSTKPRLASLYVQYLPHVKKEALAQIPYMHIYNTQTNLSQRATPPTREETSPCPKIICTLPHVKKQALAQRSNAHVYKTQTSLSLHATSSTREETPKDHMHTSTCEETSPCPQITCTCLQTTCRIASLYMQHLAFPTCEETSPSLQDMVSTHLLCHM